MGKPILFAKHIHSTFASWSSNDEWACIYISDRVELDFQLNVQMEIVSKKFPALNGQFIERIEGDALFNVVYIPSDRTFYDKALNSANIFGKDWHKTPEWKEHIKNYTEKGWTVGDLGQYQELTDFNDREEELRIERHFNSGVVLNLPHKDYVGHPELYQGGFSNGVFNSPEMKRYIGDGECVFGWIGHRLGRKAWHDTMIEEGLRARGISDEGMYSWVSSSNGRHFADALEGMSDDEQREKIEKSLNSMYNCCIIYNSPSHKGTYESTQELRVEIDSWGVLLHGESYDGSGPDKMLLYVKKVHELPNLSKENKEKMLSIVSPLVMEVYNEEFKSNLSQKDF